MLTRHFPMGLPVPVPGPPAPPPWGTPPQTPSRPSPPTPWGVLPHPGPRAGGRVWLRTQRPLLPPREPSPSSLCPEPPRAGWAAAWSPLSTAAGTSQGHSPAGRCGCSSSPAEADPAVPCVGSDLGAQRLDGAPVPASAWPGPALAVVAAWGVNQPVEDLSPLCLSNQVRSIHHRDPQGLGSAWQGRGGARGRGAAGGPLQSSLRGCWAPVLRGPAPPVPAPPPPRPCGCSRRGLTS